MRFQNNKNNAISHMCFIFSCFSIRLTLRVLCCAFSCCISIFMLLFRTSFLFPAFPAISEVRIMHAAGSRKLRVRSNMCSNALVANISKNISESFTSSFTFTSACCRSLNYNLKIFINVHTLKHRKTYFMIFSMSHVHLLSSLDFRSSGHGKGFSVQSATLLCVGRQEECPPEDPGPNR